MKATYSDDCSSVVLDEAPAKAAPVETVRTFWENAAETRWGQYVTAIERRAVLAAQAACGAPGMALEVGCEGGRWCRLLNGLGWKMIATDTNPAALRICQERNPTVRCIHVSQQEKQLPVDSETIDLLVCIEVPVVDKEWFLAEAERVLKPGGVFVGSFMNRASWRGLAANFKSRIRGKERYYAASYASFRRSLRRSAFELRDERGCCWAPFGRHSDSRLVPLAARLEGWIGVRRLPLLSPWVVFTAVRS
jgi:SAM-dependent methyltransferase